MNVLVIEDEEELSKSICTYLEKDNFICESSYDFIDAFQKLKKKNYACILLDISLPKGNGLDLLKKIKNIGKTGLCVHYFGKIL